ncbi:MAG TPA: hypothetical protein VFY22_04640, partial [Hydrogenophaga sp.]|nr:hypothetical protein [Hydrogenophaga sp.]
MTAIFNTTHDRTPTTWWRQGAPLFAASLLALAACSQETPATNPPPAPPGVEAAPTAAVNAQVAPPDFTALMKRVGPAVVNVTTRRAVSAGAASPGFPD